MCSCITVVFVIIIPQIYDVGYVFNFGFWYDVTYRQTMTLKTKWIIQPSIQVFSCMLDI